MAAPAPNPSALSTVVGELGDLKAGGVQLSQATYWGFGDFCLGGGENRGSEFGWILGLFLQGWGEIQDSWAEIW